MITIKFDKEWSLIKTKYFNIHSRPIHKRICNSELNNADDFVRKFSSELKIRIPRKIDVFVCGKKERDEIFGNNGACHAISEDWRICSNKIFHPHEITHVLMYNLVGKPIYALCEGFATYYGDKESDRDVFEKLKVEFSKSNYIPLKNLCNDTMFRGFDLESTYYESSLFIEYLIKKMGIKKFIKLYGMIKWKTSQSESIRIFEKHLNMSFERLESEFRTHLNEELKKQS